MTTSRSTTTSPRERRHRRVRARVRGTAERPRLAVFRSVLHLSAQIINDDTGRTLAAANDHGIAPEEGSTQRRVSIAREVGKAIARVATANGIQRVVFDRGGYAYHGQVKAVADGAREGGLEF